MRYTNELPSKIGLRGNSVKRESITQLKKIDGCGTIFVTTNYNNEGDIEKVFLKHGKTGGCMEAHKVVIAKLINLALEYKCPIEKITSVTEKLHCPVNDCCLVEIMKMIDGSVVLRDYK